MDLQSRQAKIQQARHNTPRREFLMEIASWKPLTFHKIDDKISVYAPHQRVHNITNPVEFEGINDDLPSLSFTTDFHNAFQQLRDQITLPGRMQFGGLDNADFTTTSTRSKNCYLSYNTSNAEDVAYSVSVKSNTKDVIDSVMIYDNSSTIYSSYAVFNGYNIFYSRFVHNSNNIWFSSNMINCSECLFCSDLENSSYYIHNQSYTKEEYMIKKSELLTQKNQFDARFTQVDRIGKNFGSDESTGSCVINSNHVTSSNSVYNINQGNNIYMSGADLNNEHIYDSVFIGALGGNHYHATVDIAKCEHIYCSALTISSSNIYYSFHTQGCSYCFGCIGIKNKQFCIYNKQYTKEERHEKVYQIFENMEQGGLLGQFLPATMCPYYFNDTIAYQIDDSFTKEEVTAAGYLWRDESIKIDIPAGADVVKVEELDQYEGWRHMSSGGGTTKEPVDLASEASVSFRASSLQSSEGQKRHIDPSITKKIIQDNQGNIYKIIPMEYNFLIKHGLPLPRAHWFTRMKQNLHISQN